MTHETKQCNGCNDILNIFEFDKCTNGEIRKQCRLCNMLKKDLVLNLRRTQNQIIDEDDRIDELQDDCERFTRDNMRYREALRNTIKEHDEFIELNTQIIKNLNDKIAKFEIINKTLSSQLDEHKKISSITDMKILQQNEQINSLKKQLNDANDNTTEANELRKRIANMTSRNLTLEQQCDDLQDRNDELRRSMKNFKKHNKKQQSHDYQNTPPPSYTPR